MVISRRALPRPFSVTAIRSGFSPASRADSPCSASAAKSSWSIPPPSSSWCTPPFARSRPSPVASGSRWRCGLPCFSSSITDELLMPANGIQPRPARSVASDSRGCIEPVRLPGAPTARRSLMSATREGAMKALKASICVAVTALALSPVLRRAIPCRGGRGGRAGPADEAALSSREVHGSAASGPKVAGSPREGVRP